MPARVPPLEFRRQLRRAATDAEQHLWLLLRRRRFDAKFRRQHTVGPYTLDLFCVEAKLCLEVDGSQHFGEEGRARDEARDAYLGARGIRVLRFSSYEVLDEEDVVLEAIWNALHGERPPSP